MDHTGLYSRPLEHTGAMHYSRPPDRAGDLVGPSAAGSARPDLGWSGPAPLVMHDSEGNPIDRGDLAGQGGGRVNVPGYPGRGRQGQHPPVPAYPAYPTPTFTYNLFPA